MKRVRIVHTADIHLDSCFGGVNAGAAAGKRLRQLQRRAFSHILDRTRQWPADILLIAGDLFEDDFVTADTLDYILESLEMLAPIQVYIVAGNRDPYTRHSPYQCEWFPRNAHVFRPGEWQALRHPEVEVTIHGVSFDGEGHFPEGVHAPSIPADGNCHIILFHGTERAHKPPEGKMIAPYDAEHLVPPGVHYVACGHFHQMTEVRYETRAPICYPGLPLGRSLPERDHHYFLEIEIITESPESTRVEIVPASIPAALIEQLQEEWSSSAASDPPSETTNYRVAPDVSRYDQTALGGLLRQVNIRLQDAPDSEARAKEQRILELIAAAFPQPMGASACSSLGTIS